MRIGLFFLIFCFLSPSFGFRLLPHPKHYQKPFSVWNEAIRTGTDVNGQALYLCTARLFDGVQPGKTWPGYNRCNIPYGGREYIMSRFEIPSGRSFGPVSWQYRQARALVIGRETNGQPLFVCQALFRNSEQPGKTWPNYPHCNISFAGKEIILDRFKILGELDPVVPNHYDSPRRVTVMPPPNSAPVTVVPSHKNPY